jgi:TctA family transporter
MSAGDFSIFFTRPISAVLIGLAIVVLIVSGLRLTPKEVRDAKDD